MPHDRFEATLADAIADLEDKGTAKGSETEIVKVLPPEGDRGPRLLLGSP